MNIVSICLQISFQTFVETVQTKFAVIMYNRLEYLKVRALILPVSHLQSSRGPTFLSFLYQ